MLDYSNGKIYAIRSPHTEEVYIGSTVSTLSKRMGQHREKFNLWKKGKQHYFTCFKLLDLGDAYIELIEEYPCENKNQLERREGQIMRETVNCVNKQIAGQTKREYREVNKKVIKEYNEEYYQANKEVLSEKHKEYYQANRDLNIQKAREYREKNKEKIKAYESKLFVCECGAEITTVAKSRHLKSKKHTDKLLILKD